MKKLVIDLGHGGYDPGAVGKGGTKEAEVVLSIGKHLDTMLKDIDLDVRFTRMSDRYVSLGDRVKFANNSGADYFLSIHINSATDDSVRGVEMWQYSDSDKKLSDFCSCLCSDIAGIFNVRNRGVKLSKNLYVLKNTFMKSALLEVDFISNASCEKDLCNEVYIKKVATAIRDNIFKLYGVSGDTSTMYKVCIGSYMDKANAVNAMNLAKSKGFKDAYILATSSNLCSCKEAIAANELALRNWGKFNLVRLGRPIEMCIEKELKGVSDVSLVEYVLGGIESNRAREIYVSFLEGRDNDERPSEDMLCKVL